MSRPIDALARFRPEVRTQAMRGLVQRVFGADTGARIWEQMEPALASRARQLGDAPAPEDNHWKGVWRVHSLDGPGDP